MVLHYQTNRRWSTPVDYRQHLGNLGAPDKAIAALQDSLSAWPEGQRRDQGLSLSRLAIAYAELGDVTAASSYGRQAIGLAKSAPSMRTLGALRRLNARLHVLGGKQRATLEFSRKLTTLEEGP